LTPARPNHSVLIEVDGITVHFDAGRSGFWGQKRLVVHAIDNISFDIHPGETLGLVGESGSGKSTTGWAILRRVPTVEGRIRFKGQDITRISESEMRPLRRHMQLVFQDPYASLNPRMRIVDIVAEPLTVHGLAQSPRDAVDRVAELLELVGLPSDAGGRYPHAFSGGQRQRIGIARALALNPDFIVADEPVSALDVSIQAQILNLLMDAQTQRGLTYMFITHDLSVVQHISTRVAVMYLGTLCELSPAGTLFESPRHPYTQALLSAIPRLGHRKSGHIKLKGEVPTPINLPSGCVFHGRCVHADRRCVEEVPKTRSVKNGVIVACHGVEEGRL